jgi:hypothetical protein
MKECKHCGFSKAWHEEAKIRNVCHVAGEMDPSNPKNAFLRVLWTYHPFEPVEEERTFKSCTIEYDKISFGLEMLRRIESLESRIEPKVASRLKNLESNLQVTDLHVESMFKQLGDVVEFMVILKKAAGGK